jgi:hypothetical protein
LSAPPLATRLLCLVFHPRHSTASC